MKKIVRWLADATGLTKEIRKEARNECAVGMFEFGYQFTNETDFRNAFTSYGYYLRYAGEDNTKIYFPEILANALLANKPNDEKVNKSN